MLKRILSMPLRILALVILALLAGVTFVLPEYLARPALGATTCLDHPGTSRRCRFEGGPIEIAGAPVFLPNFNQAFLPIAQDVVFIDASGLRWTAPAKTLTDGATIPPLFEPLIGDRQSREYLIAAALHDAYCGVGNDHLPTYQTQSWEDVHRMFYEALLVNGTPPKMARILFAAVYLGGPRWDDPLRSLEDVSDERLLREMEWCLKWIEENDPDADEIVDWMRLREVALKSGGALDPDYNDGFPGQL